MTERTCKGFAIQSANDGGGFYDMNGIGDWSLAGDAETCAIFPTREDALDVIREYDLDDTVDVLIVAIERRVSVTVEQVSVAERNERIAGIVAALNTGN